MTIKFDKLQAGVTYYDRHRCRMGNTTMTEMGEWPVKVISIDTVNQTARVQWNGNPEETWWGRRLVKLSAKSRRELDAKRKAVTP